ncbi:MAG TPA: MMPL family transporter [Smithellaceae bacterium]|nr:MMPL family transporter [Smithellaceae bacterium]HRS88090.1 MMPL family transporter [Smithellaceae bacterium]HRV25436.1 MMPL family transporter [Smithellaceae bacterium]
MPAGKYQIKWPVILFVTLVTVLFFIWESGHLKIETDILESMPQHDPVLADARQIIEHLPIQDRIFLDLEQSTADPDALVGAASFIIAELKQSGLFTKVGLGDDAQHLTGLIEHVLDTLPILLTREELQEKIEPLLSPEKIKNTLYETRRSLEQMEGIGRAEMMTRDPLGFSGIVFKKLSSLMPANNAQFYKGQLISADGRHVLIIAHIDGLGTDTAKGAKIDQLLKAVEAKLRHHPDFSGREYIITAGGAYRAALDNESIAKRDTRLAIMLTTIGIALLLIFTFPRPLIGLLALLPSMVGAISALFICSLIFKSVSMVAVGFGGAIMAFTVDLGLTYLLFLDRPQETYGRRVARQLWAAELLSVLTTFGAFLLLLISDFKILAEIGVFAALGVFFALLFVHFIFPRIFPYMPPAKRKTNPWLMKGVKIFAAPAAWKVTATLLFAGVMLFFAKPIFNVDINAMNSLRPETVAAEKKMQSVWGDFSGKCYVFLEAGDMRELQSKNDALLEFLSVDEQNKMFSNVFLPAVLFPSEAQAKKNYEAWRDFWQRQRLQNLKNDFNSAARESGFAPAAFAPFWKMIEGPKPPTVEIPRGYFEMLGIAQGPEGYKQLSLLNTGPNYDGEKFYERLSAQKLAKVFDVDFFNKRLGDFLKSIFIEIALIVSLGIVIVVLLFHLDLLLSLAVLAPISFALVATLGTLKLIGHSLDIPSIMLWIVIMGMGIDYAIYYVCMYQRYPDNDHPALDTIKLAMFMAAATTLIGFGVLALAKHSLLRSIGLTSLFGIIYSFIGTFFILPTLMRKIFSAVVYPAGPVVPASREHFRRAILRYRHLPGYPRLFARFKMRLDPMFSELHKYVQNPRRIIDIGCGYGVPATWLLEIYPQAKVFGFDPDEERVLIAARVIGERGRAEVGRAPELPPIDGSVDHVLMLDMFHLISDEEAKMVLGRIYEKLEEGGTLLIRATVPSERKIPWKRWMEAIRLKVARLPERFRAQTEIEKLISGAGFKVEVFDAVAAHVEEKWFVGRKE